MNKRYCDVCGIEITVNKDFEIFNTYYECKELEIKRDTCPNCWPKVEAAEEKYLAERLASDEAFIKKTFPIEYDGK